MPPQRVEFSFSCENGFSLCPVWSGIGNGFLGNLESVRPYLLFQDQMSEKEREICEFEMDFKKSFFAVVLILVMMT